MTEEITHSDSASSRRRPDIARKRIEAFAKRFGLAHLFFAQHAAFPLTLTPNQAYRLWAFFQRDIHGKKPGVPWIAVADLLLSNLCDEVSHELYEMNIDVREVLLSDLQANPDLGFQRIQELSDFLLKDIKHQLESNNPDVRDIANIQRWTALAYVQPGDAARELAQALQDNLEQDNKPELLRLASLVETFAQPLAAFAPLLTYARGAGYFARGDIKRAWTQMSELATSEQSVQIQGIYLPIPQPVREVEQENRDGEFEIREIQDNKEYLSLVDLTSWLWSAAETLRGAVDATRYKDFILPLIFYKRLSDVFDDEVQQYISVYGDEQLAYQNIANDRQQTLPGRKISANRFFIPKECRWIELQNRAHPTNYNLGLHINEILRTIVDMNPDLRGTLDMADYQERQGGQQVLGSRRLASLIEILSRYRLGLQDVEPDNLAQAFEYLLQQFSEAQGKSGSEFYTPKEVGQLMTHLLSPQPQSTVYDPACGSGGLLIAAYQHSKELDGNKTLKIFGQEINPITSSIAKMNVFLHDDLDANIAVGNSLTDPLFILKDSGLQTFDYIMSNPPWNQTIDDVSVFEHDHWNRFQRFGPPPRSTADWAWLEHVYASLNKNGRAAVVLPLGILFRGYRERDIRRGFVQEDIIECVIQLPENLFYGTGISCAIIMLNRNKPIERKNQILLINASSFAQKGKRKNELTSQNITVISELYQNWETHEKLSLIITQDEAQNADYNLLPSRFIRPKSAECLVLAITDLSTTYEAFQACLVDVEKISSPEGVLYRKGLFIAEHYSWDIVVAQVGFKGSEIEEAISRFHPQVVLSIGIVEGVRDVRVGDVVIATKVYGSSSVQVPTTSLLLKAQAIAQEDGWHRWVKPAVSQPAPYVISGPIASNQAIGTLNAPELLRSRFSDIVAIDTMKYGFSSYAYAHLAIRGISKIFASTKRTGGANAPKRAAQYISAFICELLANLRPGEILQPTTIEEGSEEKEYLGLAEDEENQEDTDSAEENGTGVATAMTHRLDPRLHEELLALYDELNSQGKLIVGKKLKGYYETFRSKFGPGRLGALDGVDLLELMYGLGNKDSLVYWLEFKNDEEFPAFFGSIAGGSAFKYGLFYKREPGIWISGSPQKPIELSVEQAIEKAKRHRDQLLAGCEVLETLSLNTDADYEELQQKMDRVAPEVSDSAWGHKYFSLVHPEKLDDYHVSNYQRYHLIKLLQIPPTTAGRYVASGRYIAVAHDLNIAVNTLTRILSFRNGYPHNYWQIGIRSGDTHTSYWDEMCNGKRLSIGWAETEDLSKVTHDDAGRQLLRTVVQDIYPDYTSAIMSKTVRQLFDFKCSIEIGAIVLVSDGERVLSIARVTGDYFYDPKSAFSHCRPVEWLSLALWRQPEPEGLQTIVHQMTKAINLVEAEKKILDAKDSRTFSPIVEDK